MKLPSQGYSWIECRSHEYYPKIGVSFPTGTVRVVNQLLFDSGSDHSYLSSQIVDREELDIDDFVIQQVDVRGRPHVVVEAELAVALHDGVSIKTGTAPIVFVYNWTGSAWATGCNRNACNANSEQVCTERTGLISTKLLHDLGTKVLLDGNSRTLTIA